MKTTGKNTTKETPTTVGDLFFQEIFSNIPGHVYIKDKNGVYLAANNRDELSCATDGTKEGSQLIGKTDLDFPWKNESKILREHDIEVMQTKKTKIFIEHGKLKNGNMGLVCSIKAPFYDKDGNVIGIIGNSIDLTEIKNQLKQELDQLK